MIGAIVAGGPSTRFNGEPKGLHSVGGQRIIDRVASAMREVCSELILVSSIPGAGEWLTDVEVLPDRWPARGSMVGLHAALARARQPVLVVAWDMPFVTAELLSRLVDRSTRSESATVPVTANGFEPMCAIYGPKCLPLIEEALESSELSLTRLILRLPGIERVETADLESIGDPAMLFFNVNDSADLAYAEQLFRSSVVSVKSV